MLEPLEPRWYYVHVDFGPGIAPWLVAIEATSPEEARSHLARDLAAKGAAATIVEVGLLADLPGSDDGSDDEANADADAVDQGTVHP